MFYCTTQEQMVSHCPDINTLRYGLWEMLFEKKIPDTKIPER